MAGGMAGGPINNQEGDQTLETRNVKTGVMQEAFKIQALLPQAVCVLGAWSQGFLGGI